MKLWPFRKYDYQCDPWPLWIGFVSYLMMLVPLPIMLVINYIYPSEHVVTIGVGISLYCPVFGGTVAVIVGLLRGGDIHHASRTGQSGWLRRQLAEGASFNWRNGFCQAPVYLAIRHRHLDCVVALVERGVPVNDDFWKTAEGCLSEVDLIELRCLVQKVAAR